MGQSLLGLGVFGSLSVGGLVEMTNSVMESMAEVEMLSERTRLATEMIDGMAKAGRQFDISAQSMAGGLENVNSQLGLIASGAPTRLKRIMDAYGLSAKNASGKTKDVMTFFGDLADKVQQIEAKGGNAQGLIGRLGLDPNMLLMLRQGRQAFLDMYETAKASIPFTAEDHKRAEEFEKGWRQAKAQIDLVRKSIAFGLQPALQKFLD